MTADLTHLHPGALQPAAQGVDANANVSGNLLGPLCSVTIRQFGYGAVLYTDPAHIKAKANKHKKTTVVVERTPKAYPEELDEAIERDRRELGRKPFGRKDDDDPPPTREVSKSDPESGRL